MLCATFWEFLLSGYNDSFAGKRIWQTDPGCGQQLPQRLAGPGDPDAAHDTL